MSRITLEQKVLYILENYPVTRNDDTHLTYAVILYYMPDAVMKNLQGTLIRCDALKKYREDHIKRVRAKIQNERHLYLPTDPSVRKKRKIAEEDWLNWSRKS